MKELIEKRLYLHSDGKWTDNPQGALLRLDSRQIGRWQGNASNHFFSPDSEGGWQPVLDLSALSASQRGLDFAAWKTEIDGQAFLAVSGPRVIDSEMASELLGEVSVYDRKGQQLSDPTEAGDTFLLDAAGARRFTSRVKELGGTVSRAEISNKEAEQAVSAAEQILAGLSSLADADRVDIEKARSGNFTGQKDFERRGKEIRDLSGRLHHLRSRAQDLVSASSSQSLEEQSLVRGSLSRVEELWNEAGIILEARGANEAELISLLSGGNEVDMPPAARRLLAEEMGRLAREQGLSVVSDEHSVRIEVEAGRWLDLQRFTLSD